ncbi:MAG: CPBP family intramembrane glutamic endopeptidase, partial [Pseudomonadota bacterium]
ALWLILAWTMFQGLGRDKFTFGNEFFLQCILFTVVIIEAVLLNRAFKFQTEEESSLSLFSLYSARWQEILIAVAVAIALTFPLNEIDNLLQAWYPPGELENQVMMARYFPSNSIEKIFVMLNLVAVAPIGEELLFRGVMMTWLRRRGRWWVALLVTTFLFAASHFSLPRTIFPIVFVGLVLGWLVLRTGSIFPAIAAHAAFNGFPLMSYWSGLKIGGYNDISEENARVSPALWIAGIAATAICLYALEQFTKKRQKEEEEKEEKND